MDKNIKRLVDVLHCRGEEMVKLADTLCDKGRPLEDYERALLRETVASIIKDECDLIAFNTFIGRKTQTERLLDWINTADDI